MAIDLSKNQSLVFFEIDTDSPHNLSRFNRHISQAIALGEIAEDDFEQTIGSYEGVMNVGYVLTRDAYLRLFSGIELFLRGQTEVYQFMPWSTSVQVTAYRGSGWCTLEVRPVTTLVFADTPPTELAGWTYFPASKTYLAMIFEEEV